MLLADWQILEYVEARKGSPVPASELLEYVEGDKARLSRLCRENLLRRNDGWFTDGGASYSLGPAGADVLALHRQHLEENERKDSQHLREREEDRANTTADNRKKSHHDYLVAAFQVLLGFAIGLVTEYKCQIIAFIVELFEK